jgi:hypothetical protein
VPPVAPPPPPRRRGNGLLASNFVALADVDPRLGAHLLDLLRLAEVPAYLEPATSGDRTGRAPRDRLYVAGALRAEALAVVAAAADEAGGRVVNSDGSRPGAAKSPGEDPLAGIDTDAAFAALVAGWDAPDAPTAPGGELTAPILRDEPEEEHFEPPTPPPLPRLSSASVAALALIGAGVVLIAHAEWLGFSVDLGFPLGIVGVLTGFGVLVSRLRDDSKDGSTEDDDGAVV